MAAAVVEEVRVAEWEVEEKVEEVMVAEVAEAREAVATVVAAAATVVVVMVAAAGREVEAMAAAKAVSEVPMVVPADTVEVKTEAGTCLACNRPCPLSHRRRGWAKW